VEQPFVGVSKATPIYEVKVPLTDVPIESKDNKQYNQQGRDFKHQLGTVCNQSTCPTDSLLPSSRSEIHVGPVPVEPMQIVQSVEIGRFVPVEPIHLVILIQTVKSILAMIILVGLMPNVKIQVPEPFANVLQASMVIHL